MALRDYQHEWKGDIYDAWRDGARVVMATMATGGGKTTSFCSVLQDMNAPAAAIAHRQELVAQTALALNREGIPHGVIAPAAVVREIVRLEIDTHGQSLFQARAPIRVAGVHTLAARGADGDRWFQQVQTVVIDEGHHVLRESIWAKTLALFPHARVLLPTAHACRADGRGLGAAADGIVDRLVLGPCGRDLIARGFLSDYRVAVAPSDVDVSDVPVGTGGDFVNTKLRAAVHRSKTIVGDVAAHYVKFAGGKLGLTFAVDIEAAGELVGAYRALGVPADIITADTPINVRATLMRRFRNRDLLQLVSVDVLGEGTDVPAVEVVSMARHTASWQLYCQQVGRALRVSVAPELMARWDQFTDAERVAHIAASSKPRAILLDHVGNFERHYKTRGTPDSRQEYSLLRAERKSRANTDAIPLRTCTECLQPYERIFRECPYCANPAPPPAGRATPEQVDGELIELDAAALAALRGEVARVDRAAVVSQKEDADPIIGRRIYLNHLARQQAQATLRDAMALFGGWLHAQGRDDGQIQREFFFRFGIDVLTAQTLGAKDAAALETRVRDFLNTKGVVRA